jgi:hypothetical protein
LFRKKPVLIVSGLTLSSFSRNFLMLLYFALGQKSAKKLIKGRERKVSFSIS